jgi:hypothetical protein
VGAFLSTPVTIKKKGRWQTGYGSVSDIQDLELPQATQGFRQAKDVFASSQREELESRQPLDHVFHIIYTLQIEHPEHPHLV